MPCQMLQRCLPATQQSVSPGQALGAPSRRAPRTPTPPPLGKRLPAHCAIGHCVVPRHLHDRMVADVLLRFAAWALRAGATKRRRRPATTARPALLLRFAASVRAAPGGLRTAARRRRRPSRSCLGLGAIAGGVRRRPRNSRVGHRRMRSTANASTATVTDRTGPSPSSGRASSVLGAHEECAAGQFDHVFDARGRASSRTALPRECFRDARRPGTGRGLQQAASAAIALPEAGAALGVAALPILSVAHPSPGAARRRPGVGVPGVADADCVVSHGSFCTRSNSWVCRPPSRGAYSISLWLRFFTARWEET